MEIPILLGANPKIADPSTWIPVRFDKWTVRVEGLVNSRLILHSNKPGFTDITVWTSLNGRVFNGPCEVRAEFVERGTEKAITIFAVEHK